MSPKATVDVLIQHHSCHLNIGHRQQVRHRANLSKAVIALGFRNRDRLFCLVRSVEAMHKSGTEGLHKTDMGSKGQLSSI